MSQENLSNSLPNVNPSTDNYWHKNSSNLTLPIQLDPLSSEALGNNALCTTADYINVCPNLLIIGDSKAVRISPQVPSRSESDISCFSQNSRLRLMRLCGRVNTQSYADVMHCTLTYHNSYPSISAAIKTNFHNFYKILRYHFPSVSIIWRLEFQRRGAPHYHLILLSRKKYFSKNCQIEQKRLTSLWLLAIKDDNISLRLHGCKCTRCNDNSKFFTYISKYSAKVESNNVTPYSGRRWGYSDDLDQTSLLCKPYTNTFIHLFKQRLVDLLHSQGRLSNEFRLAILDNQLIQVFMSADESLRLLTDVISSAKKLGIPIK